MKVFIVSGILMLVVYAQAASIPEVEKNQIMSKNFLESNSAPEIKTLVIEVEPSEKVDQPSSELTREKRQFGYGGGYGGGHGGYGGYG
jgi:hypothetical protein